TWVPGELFIGGAGVAHGYWNDPTRTAERFLTHPATGERLYRTGDLGRYHPDGTIEFLGRNDHQVKINGYRIELGEIEAKLTTHPNVKDTVVTTTDNHLTAYVTRAESAPDDPDQLVGSLRAALAVALPDYMIPRNFVLLDTLPLSANGKVDRGALPAPLPQPTGGSPSRGDADPVGAQGSEPRNDMERRLRDIWKEVLGLEAVSVHDDFGQLGGDSLLALRVISRAAEAGLELTPRQFFEHPTIAGLAGVATLAVPRPAEEQPTEVIGDVPLLPAQAMLLAGLDATVARHHNYALFFELDEPLNKVALRVALRTLISRHDSLRTGFVHGPKGWRQHVATVDEVSVVPMEWLDLGDMPAEEQGRTIEELAEQAQRSFDLAEPPLLRVLYFDRGRDRKPELLLVAHWLVVDNFSLRIVLGDLLAAHAQIAEYGHAELPAPGTPAAVWAEQVARQTEQTGVTSQPPFERARHGTARDAVTLVEVLDSRATDRLREQTNSSVVLGDVILAALARAARATGLGESIRVDVDGHGRGAVLPGVASPIDLSRTVGRLSVRNQLEVPALQDPVRAAKTVAAVRAALPNGGLDDAVTAYGTTAVADGLSAPAPEFAFNYLGTVDELYAITGLRPSGHRPGPLVHPETPLRHRFELLCGTVEGELLIGLTCPGIDQPEAEHLLKNFMAELRGVEAAVERPAAANGRDTRGAALADTFRRWLSPAAAD
ncbi:condensation domain-containing protein, partial [Streptomyces rochei]|uniref:condensation domain-containing protein n=1 Tax=Streptomyces rochei TaxID=1928 RepID=UPI0033BDEC41